MQGRVVWDQLLADQGRLVTVVLSGWWPHSVRACGRREVYGEWAGKMLSRVEGLVPLHREGIEKSISW